MYDVLKVVFALTINKYTSYNSFSIIIVIRLGHPSNFFPRIYAYGVSNLLSGFSRHTSRLSGEQHSLRTIRNAISFNTLVSSFLLARQSY